MITLIIAMTIRAKTRTLAMAEWAEKKTDWFSSAGDRDLHQGVRRLHYHQQREEPVGHPAEGHDGVLLPGGDPQVPLPAFRGQAWGELWVAAQIISWTPCKYLVEFSGYSPEDVFSFRWTWTGGCSTLKLIFFLSTHTSPGISSRQNETQQKRTANDTRKDIEHIF